MIRLRMCGEHGTKVFSVSAGEKQLITGWWLQRSIGPSSLQGRIHWKRGWARAPCWNGRSDHPPPPWKRSLWYFEARGGGPWQASTQTNESSQVPWATLTDPSQAERDREKGRRQLHRDWWTESVYTETLTVRQTHEHEGRQADKQADKQAGMQEGREVNMHNRGHISTCIHRNLIYNLLQTILLPL